MSVVIYVFTYLYIYIYKEGTADFAVVNLRFLIAIANAMLVVLSSH